MSDRKTLHLTLKIALFATGCAGIVAEFVLSTLATYLVGNAVFQWTIVMSLMLFAMGLGSRLSRYFTAELIDWFILVEFSLSLLVSVSAVVAYSISPHTGYTDLLIYGQAVVIGLFIGLEIPLVIRINDAYEELRINISGVMEKDYYGALLGGFGFAFFALPYLGLTYTPIVLGIINFSVACLVLWHFFSMLERKRLLICLSVGIACFFIILIRVAEPVILYGEQKQYRDKIIHSQQTAFQKIVITQWKSYYWLYLNNQEQFSTYDEERYHEPLVHPVMATSPNPQRILVLGGGDGLALREIFKYPSVTSVTLVDLDPAMTRLAKTHPVLVSVNQNAMNDPRVRVVNTDAAKFLNEDDHLYDVIIIDLPDPDAMELMHVYSQSFYKELQRHMSKGAFLITQATSPFFTRKAFLCILKTIRSAGYTTIPLHNNVPTLGEWGWIMAVNENQMDSERLKRLVMTQPYDEVPTRFLNQDAVISMLYFGKGVVDPAALSSVEINKRTHPVLYSYYMGGSWGVY